MTNNEAELWAVYQGLCIAIRNGYSNLEIVGDSRLVIDMLRKLRDGQCWDHVAKSWRTAAIVKDVEEVLRRIEYTTISHVLREGNRAADLMANWGSGGGDRRIDGSWRSVKDDPRWTMLTDILNHDLYEATTSVGNS